VVVVDLNMPIMGGIEMMQAVTRGMMRGGDLVKYDITKFILSTAQGEQGTTDRFLEFGF